MQVGFRDQKLILKANVEKRINAIVNRLNAVKREEYPDLAAEREAYEKEVCIDMHSHVCACQCSTSHIRMCSQPLEQHNEVGLMNAVAVHRVLLKTALFHPQGF